jgi:carbonic anhydrase
MNTSRTKHSGSRSALAACLVTALLGLACAQAEHEGASEHAGVVHWGYEGQEGPSHWAELNPAWAVCGDGTHQSPVDLGEAVEGGGATLRTDYGRGTLSIARNAHVVDFLDNGHTIQVKYDRGSTVAVGDLEFELVQFHFHAPSEHTVDGRHYPIEMHLVHRSEDGELAVIGVFIEEGEHHPAFEALIEGLPSEVGEERHFEEVEIDVDTFMPPQDRFYRYEGSLTTPPCTEGVRWAVMAKPVRASAEQIAALDAAMPENNRPVQRLGEREVVLIFR